MDVQLLNFIIQGIFAAIFSSVVYFQWRDKQKIKTQIVQQNRKWEKQKRAWEDKDKARDAEIERMQRDFNLREQEEKNEAERYKATLKITGDLNATLSGLITELHDDNERRHVARKEDAEARQKQEEQRQQILKDFTGAVRELRDETKRQNTKLEEIIVETKASTLQNIETYERVGGLEKLIRQTSVEAKNTNDNVNQLRREVTVVLDRLAKQPNIEANVKRFIEAAEVRILARIDAIKQTTETEGVNDANSTTEL